jgi:hypothetical protein
VAGIGYNQSVEVLALCDEGLAMERMTVPEAGRDFGNLVNRVCSEGISIELEQGDKVVARLTPEELPPSLKVGDLNAFLKSLPQLGNDAGAFDEDLCDIRHQFPVEADPYRFTS